MTTGELDFARICRVCCEEGQMLSIYKIHFHKKIMACASVKVWENDGLPAQICTKCIGKLHIAYQFKKLCEESDARLRHHLLTMKMGIKNEDNSINLENPVESACEIGIWKNENEECENTLASSDLCRLVKETSAIEISDYKFEPRTCEQEIIEEGYLSPDAYIYIGCESDITEIKDFKSLGITETPFYTFANLHENQSEDCDIESLGKQVTVVREKSPDPVLNVDEIPSLNEYCPNTDPSSFEHLKFTTAKENIKVNIPNITYSCDKCGKSFSSVSRLKRHVRTHATKMPFRCDFCHKGFAHSGNFKVHLRTHTGERPYQCDICDHSCRQLQDLEKHIRTHTGERPHICEICNKKFLTSSNLIVHYRTHSGEKPYICTYCQKAFSQSQELKRHLRMHTGEKSHICNVCNKGFNGSSSLVKHMRSHTGERPYICSLCNNRFKQLSCLRVHIRRQSCIVAAEKLLGKKRFSCAKCEKSYCRASTLRQHMKVHTSEEADPIFN